MTSRRSLVPGIRHRLSGLDGTGSIRPRLVVVLTNPQNETRRPAAVETVLKSCSDAQPGRFCDCRRLPRSKPVIGSQSLRAPSSTLSLELETSQAARSQAHLLFSAVHLEWIFRNLLWHVAHGSASPFNYIQAFL